MIAHALLALAVIAPGADTPTVDTFGPHAGFGKAILERQVITVALPPEFWGEPMTEDQRAEWLQPMLDSWNDAAGWVMFAQVYSDEVADVTFHVIEDEPVCHPDAAACTWIDEFTSGQYRFRHCFIELWPWFPTPDVVTHELGHCLGFVDVPEPVEGGYDGIMIYDRPWGMTPDNEYDRASLVEAGYRLED